MSERDLDDLVRFYQSHAQESPAAWLDARVLQQARVARRQRQRRLALAAAACLLLVMSAGLRRSQPAADTSLTTLETRSHNYLLQMDIPIHASPLTRQMLELPATRGD
ncbi:MAG: hypothetical protein ABW154_08855 [Dyella sp.]